MKMKKSTLPLMIGIAAVGAWYLQHQINAGFKVTPESLVKTPISPTITSPVSSMPDKKWVGGFQLYGDTVTFTDDPSAGANVVELSPAEIAAMTPEQQAGLNPASTKKSILPAVAMVAAAALFLS